MQIGAGIKLRGIDHESFNIPFNLAAGIVAADVGKPMALDTTAPNTAKLAGDADVIIGQLRVVENRGVEGTLVGTISILGFFDFAVASATTIAVGLSVTGSAVANEIKAAVVANGSSVVVESSAGLATVWLK